MKRNLSFSEFVSRDILTHGLILGIILFLVEQFSFAISFSASGNVRFANEIDEARFGIIFVGALILASADLVWCIVRRFIGSKSIYSLYMMPVPKPLLYFTWLFSGVLVVMILVLARHLSVLCAYLQYEAGIAAYIAEHTRAGSGMATSVRVEGGALFTAYLRCEHLRMFLPFDFESGAKLFFTLFSLPALSIRFALSIFAKKLTFSIILAVMWVLFMLLLGEATFLGFVGLSFVALFSFFSGKNMATLGQML